ncbi:type IV pilus twitching motility protein PilT [Micavibrio aeruginosavorus]|uniref:type IV pilus twitching motility protein PilT n=1 Tax=Micavibrio aeruginosavorus TaxID=349221 RepID=UPI003F4AB9E5
MDILQLLRFTIQNNASDLHLSPTNPPVIRVNGEMKRIKADPLQSDDIRTMLYSVMNEDQRADFERELELDFAIAYGEKARFRVNAFTTRNGTAAVFRSIPSLIPTMEELELPPIIRRFAELEKGLVLVTGPTGSGKSTTLASIINYINENHASHIITVEDPVEFFHASKKAVVNHREIGTDTKSFSKALRSSLREDPDVILVGEMRDYETISLALTAAETGHLVFGTLHSNTAAKTIDRIIDVFPSGDKEMVRAMLASSLQGVVAQSLLKRADGSGRVGAFEVLVGTNAVRNLIRENQIAQLYSMIQTGSRYGMTTLEDSVNALLEQGVIDKDEARRALMKTTEDEGARDEDTVSASLGGGKMSETMSRKQAAVGRAPGAQPRKAGEDDSGEGYTF